MMIFEYYSATSKYTPVRGTFKSFWDLLEVSTQSWCKVRFYELVNPTFIISLLGPQIDQQEITFIY